MLICWISWSVPDSLFRLQTLRECVYQSSTKTCTCFAGILDPRTLDPEGEYPYTHMPDPKSRTVSTKFPLQNLDLCPSTHANMRSARSGIFTHTLAQCRVSCSTSGAPPPSPPTWPLTWAPNPPPHTHSQFPPPLSYLIFFCTPLTLPPTSAIVVFLFYAFYYYATHSSTPFTLDPFSLLPNSSYLFLFPFSYSFIHISLLVFLLLDT